MAVSKDKDAIKKSGRRKKAGRPSKLNILTTRKICKLIEQGIRKSTAYMSLGISRSCYSNWMAQARAGTDPDCETLFKEVEKAEANYDLKLEKKLHEHTINNDDKDLLKWQLPKRNRRNWGEPNDPSLTVTVDGGKIKPDQTIDYMDRIRRSIDQDEQTDPTAD